MRVALIRLEAYSPFNAPVWQCLTRPITRGEVGRAIAHKTFEEAPIGPTGSRRAHIRRVAYLVVHPDANPISVDVGVRGLCSVSWPIMDGHHRLAAAFYRGDETIGVEASGSVDLIQEFLCSA